MTESAQSYGANSTFSLIGEYLTSGLGDYGGAIREITITACFRGGEVRLPERYKEFHLNVLPSLPQVKFRRKRGEIDIKYETRVGDATFLERHGWLSVDFVRAAAVEVAGALDLIGARLKKSDDFDLGRLKKDVAGLLAQLPSTDEEVRSLDRKLDEEKKARRAAMGPWERLGIHWDDYHPKARTILNDPFFWSEIDDNAPHGNDTGSDLLAEFRKWDKRHPEAPAHEMVTWLLDKWGISAVDPEIQNGNGIRWLMENEQIALDITNEAMIAGAFAAIKLRGCCDARTRELALAAIARERTMIEIAGDTWPHSGERLESLRIVEDVLVNLSGVISGQGEFFAKPDDL